MFVFCAIWHSLVRSLSMQFSDVPCIASLLPLTLGHKFRRDPSQCCKQSCSKNRIQIGAFDRLEFCSLTDRQTHRQSCKQQGNIIPSQRCKNSLCGIFISLSEFSMFQLFSRHSFDSFIHSFILAEKSSIAHCQWSTASQISCEVFCGYWDLIIDENGIWLTRTNDRLDKVCTLNFKGFRKHKMIMRSIKRWSWLD